MPTFLINTMDNDSQAPAFIDGTTFAEDSSNSGLVTRGGWSQGGYSTDDFQVFVPYYNDDQAPPLLVGSNRGIFSVKYFAPGEYIATINGTYTPIQEWVVGFIIYNQNHPDGAKQTSYSSFDPDTIDENSNVYLELEVADNGNLSVKQK